MRKRHGKEVELMTRWSEATLADPTPTQCPECGAAGSLVDFFCEVCYAELDEVAK
jgi:hypothetical protein